MRAVRIVRCFDGGEKAQVVNWRCAKRNTEPLVNVRKGAVDKTSIFAAGCVDCKERAYVGGIVVLPECASNAGEQQEWKHRNRVEKCIQDTVDLTEQLWAMTMSVTIPVWKVVILCSSAVRRPG